MASSLTLTKLYRGTPLISAPCRPLCVAGNSLSSNWRSAMRGIIAVTLLSSMLSACVQERALEAGAPATPAPPPAAAPTVSPAVPTVDRLIVIQRATCDTFLGLPPEDRAAASLFYMGYSASRFRLKTVNASNIPDIQTRAINNCSAQPERTVAWAFARAYSQNRGW
jgi:hypothetical protein